MSERRIAAHPILPPQAEDEIPFSWQGEPMAARAGETIAAALIANGVRVFGHHPKDGAPQGLFCANGQCAGCMVLADRRPVKACMTLVAEGMAVTPLEGLPALAETEETRFLPETWFLHPIERVKVPALIVGGGPAGLSAAIELGRWGVETLLVDDKGRLGGKLVLQTHRFFGSAAEVYAGTRGIDIATRLEAEVRALAGVAVWLDSTALAVYADRQVGIWRGGTRYALVEPRVLLVAAGARERSLAFPGSTLPGVYGAGAFQTLVNRDRVRAAERLLIVGGGNVGLIAGYHALQAGIEVVGLVEALPACGGYRVHRDKLARLGVPIYTSHTIVSASGREGVEAATIAQVNERLRPLPGTERSFACDTVLIAVGLSPVDEFVHQARACGLPVYAAGDADEIAEASAAMVGGRIRGREMARALGCAAGPVPAEWQRAVEILKSRPGRTVRASQPPPVVAGVAPVLHCVQEIPCDPCVAACPQGLIRIPAGDIRGVPVYVGEEGSHERNQVSGRNLVSEHAACIGCARCVAACPGLAITLVDAREDAARPLVTVPYEFLPETIGAGSMVVAVDRMGQALGPAEVAALRAVKAHDRTLLLELRVPADYARRVTGIRVQEAQAAAPLDGWVEPTADEAIVCRCERVSAGTIRALVRQGCRDINEIKALTRAGMGACGGKTCMPLIERIFRQEGVPADEVTGHVLRPVFVEVPLGTFAGDEEGA